MKNNVEKLKEKLVKLLQKRDRIQEEIQTVKLEIATALRIKITPEEVNKQSKQIAILVLHGGKTLKQAGKLLGLSTQVSRNRLHAYCRKQNRKAYGEGKDYLTPQLTWLKEHADEFLYPPTPFWKTTKATLSKS